MIDRTELAKSRVGQVLRGKLRLDGVLGVGGMATVYTATHRNRKRVAVKMLHPEHSADSDARARFLREGYASNSIGHPGCVSVTDDDIAEDGSVFIVMELLEGETLAHRAERCGGRLPAAEIVHWTIQLLDVLAAAHDKGVIHRDIKPDNVFATKEGRLKVLDFGIARTGNVNQAKLTVSGSVMGTPAFMPPEQALSKWDLVDARSDLWAVGATMFFLLTGRQVHEEEALTALLIAISTKPVVPIKSVLPSIPLALAAIVDRALSLDRAQRFPDARAMQAALRAAMATSRDLLMASVIVPVAEDSRATTADQVHGKTISGPSPSFPDITGVSQPLGQTGTLLTSSTAIAQPSKRAVPLAIAGVLVVGAAIVIGLVRSSPSDSTPAAQPHSTAPVAPPPIAPAPPPATPADTAHLAPTAPTASIAATVSAAATNAVANTRTTTTTATTKTPTTPTATTKTKKPGDALGSFN